MVDDSFAFKLRLEEEFFRKFKRIMSEKFVFCF
jgi:hypothetical protein